MEIEWTTEDGFTVTVTHDPNCCGCEACDPAWAGDLASYLCAPPPWVPTVLECADEIWWDGRKWMKQP